MKFQQKKLVLALAHALGAAAVIAGVPALAQDAQPADKIKVDVVGSSIKRTLEDQALPVQVITREEIGRSGVVNMEELVQKISATASAGATTGATLAGQASYGLSSVSLRGLGSTRTLVLLDGRRMVPFANAVDGSVDINSIPISAIERVEVLTDGASSVYGSDAEAGVINFILRKDFTGLTAGYDYNQPTRSGGGNVQTAYASFGMGSLTKDRYNFTISGQWKKEEALFARDRDFAKSGNLPPFLANAATPSGRIEGIWIPGSFPYSVNNRNSTTNPFGITGTGYGNPGADGPGGCAGMGMFAVSNKPAAGTGTNCNYDSAPDVGLFPESVNSSGVMTFNFQITPQAQAYFQGTYSQNKVTEIYQPSPARVAFFQTDNLFPGSGVDQALLISPTNPNYPSAWLNSHGLSAMNGQTLAVSSRVFAAGGRTEEDTNTQQHWVAGVKGTWLKDWDYDVGAQFDKSESTGTVTAGYFSQVGLAQAINTVGNTAGSYWDPWAAGGQQNATLSSAIQSANYVGPTALATQKMTGFDAKTSGTAWELPAGPVSVAVGAQYLKQEYNVSVPDILGLGDIAGLGGATSNSSGDRTITGAFAEVALPVLKTLDINLSGRVDHYNDIQSDATPVTGKFSASWRPTTWSLVRGSFGNGFRAPSMIELHRPVNLGTSEQFTDPAFPENGQIQVNAYGGGNPNLKPEKSTQGSLGFVLTPTAGFSARVDYWAIDIKNFIVSPPALAMINAARAGTNLFHPGEVTFLEDGEVDTVDETTQNAGKASFAGFDFGANWRGSFPFGRLGFDYSGTYYTKADLTIGDRTEKNIGTLVDPQQNPLTLPIAGGVILRYKQTAGVSWDWQGWGATLVNNYITGYQTAANQVDGEPHSVASFSTWDIQGTYSGFKNVKFVVGAKNMFDRNPHLFIPTANFFQYGYDPTQYDPRARVVYGRVEVSFK